MTQPGTQGLHEDAPRPVPRGMSGFWGVDKEEIIKSWEARATAACPEFPPTGLALQEDIPALLDELLAWLPTDASPETSLVATRALAHVMQRLDAGLLAQVLREFRVLRDILIGELLRTEPAAHERAHIDEVSRLNAGLDVVLAQFVEHRELQAAVERDRTAQAVEASDLQRKRALAEAESGHQLLDAIMDNVPEGITIADAPDVRIRRVSRYGQMLTGKAAAVLEGITVTEHAQMWEVFDAAGVLARNEDLPLTRATQKGEVVRDEEWALGHPSGGRIPILCNASPVRDAAGAIVGGIVAWRDITERKRAEEALKRANIQLADADRRKDEFLAVLSHELRNPLAPIANSLYVLDRAASGSAQAERARQVIGRQVKLLTNLVNDLLDVTRITTNKVQLQKARVELNELVRRVVEDHLSLFEQAGVGLAFLPAQQPVPVHVDSSRMAQVVGNLLQNAVKFTGRGGQTRVSVAVEGGEAVVRVADDGAGMSRETLDRLFLPFSQAEHTLDRSKGGLGLGLALVKGLVELHDGSVSAHSGGLGRGAEMMVRLGLRQE